MPKLPKKITDKLPQPKAALPPLWKGPEVDGITYSMLTRFLSCRERFRVRYIEGLKPADQFNHRIEFGQMWHICEEAHASRGQWWDQNLLKYAQQLAKRYPTAQEQIRNWYNICLLQFPIYVDYWKEHPDVLNRTPLMQEQVFGVEYPLPSGRIVRLRGKWDSVDLISDKNGGIYLQENKTKGDIEIEQITRQMGFDLQTMLYLVALNKHQDNVKKSLPLLKAMKGLAEYSQNLIRGVRYNVVKRPRQYQGKKETHAQFYDRLRGIIQEAPQDFFFRLRVEVTPTDIERFKQRCLNPVLEQLCDWWDWIAKIKGDPFDCAGSGGIHWQHPFGSINYLDEGGSSDVDSYLTTGSTLGLVREESLFTELQ